LHFFGNVMDAAPGIRSAADVGSPFFAALRWFYDNAKTLGEFAAGLLAVSAAASRFWRVFRRSVARYFLNDLKRRRPSLALPIKQATEHYIEPDCQSLDPSGSEDFRRLVATRERAFAVLDKLLGTDSPERYFLILADSGMGKTSLLLNYYSRFMKGRRGSGPRMEFVSLAEASAIEEINGIKEQRSAILLLDALDEDTSRGDHKERLFRIMKAASRFQSVVITCRTQYFARDTEIPKEAGKVRIFAGPSQDKEYSFYKIYLSPFSDAQIRKLIHAIWPVWQWDRRRRAMQIVERMADLKTRPLLLAHVKELVDDPKSGRVIGVSSDIYEEMVAMWLQRERRYANPDQLLKFSELLAAYVYLNRTERGSETVGKDEAVELAREFSFELDGWQIAGRSLLNRDAEGNLKFAHRSIMEFLFIKYYLKNPQRVGKVEWTDQMKIFWWELLFHSRAAVDKQRDPRFLNADSSGLYSLRLQPILLLRSNPRTLTFDKARECSREHAIKNPLPNHFSETIQIGTGPQSTSVVVDYCTGLMWHSPQLAARQSELETYLRQLNAFEHGGFSDWRLPTIDEALGAPLLIDRGPSPTDWDGSAGAKNVLWTADKVAGEDTHWSVSAAENDAMQVLGPVVKQRAARVRAVRTFAAGLAAAD
jgi:hypothetical protein